MTTTEHSATRSKTSELAPRLRHNLAKNLALLQKHRPQVFATVSAIDAAACPYSIEPVAGKPAIFHRNDDGSLRCLSQIHNGRLVADPAAAYRQSLAARTAKALCGIGDGAILDWLARNEPTDAASMTSGAGTVYLIEPDVHLLLHCLMVRDMSQAIEQKRFYWFIGPDCQSDASQTLLEEPMLVDGLCVIGQGTDSADLTTAWKQLMTERREAFAADCQAAAAHAATLNREELASLFSERPPRSPRVLLMTSHHTTVLQYSTRDAAEAFAELGWQTQLLIEREVHHVIGEAAVLRAIAQFKPDLIFTIDHLRSELPHVPREIPFVCWIQDNLPNLTSEAAAGTVSLTDYIIGGWVQQYVQRHGYPQRQCIATRRMTRPIRTVHPPRSRVEDMVYVSNHSDLPQDRLRRMLRERPLPRIARAAELLHETGTRLIDLYSKDGCVYEMRGVSDIAQKVATSSGHQELAADVAESIALFLGDLRDMLHRQQAVRWAADIARRHGLTLGLYGSGWERHPEFAEHARGPVAYGDDLQALTQQACMNLQLEAFAPTQHQRLLDGLAAGGFFLCRLRHPLEAQFVRLLRLADNLDARVVRDADASSMLNDEQMRELSELRDTFARARPQRRDEDFIAWMRGPRVTELFAAMRVAPLPPHYFDVAFASAAEFGVKVQQYMHDESRRKRLVAAQRAFVEEHFTYVANLREVAQRIGNLIADEC